MAAGRGSIATSSRVSCTRLTTDATPTTKPIPSFGSRRPLPRLRTEILRRRSRGNARAVVGRPPALPDPPSAVVRSLAADRCAALSQKAEARRGTRRAVGWVSLRDTHHLRLRQSALRADLLCTRAQPHAAAQEVDSKSRKSCAARTSPHIQLSSPAKAGDPVSQRR